MSDFKAKMGSAPDPTGGAYSAPPDPLAVFKGPKGKEAKGKGKRMGREGRGGENDLTHLLSQIPGYATGITKDTEKEHFALLHESSLTFRRFDYWAPERILRVFNFSSIYWPIISHLSERSCPYLPSGIAAVAGAPGGVQESGPPLSCLVGSTQNVKIRCDFLVQRGVGDRQLLMTNSPGPPLNHQSK